LAHYWSETGAVVYGSMGIKREDLAARRTAVLRNWEFFRAPGIAMHRNDSPAYNRPDCYVVDGLR
jgi:hypothetical protein